MAFPAANTTRGAVAPLGEPWIIRPVKVTDQRRSPSTERALCFPLRRRPLVPPTVAVVNVLALCTYPDEAACTRFRLTQLVQPLADRGIRVTVSPFLDSRTFSTLYKRSELSRTALGLARCALRRLGDVRAARHADLIFVQREAMLFGPPVLETLTTRGFQKRPMVLDLDDATYLSYVSLTYGRLARLLKWPGKTESLIRAATLVTCGNREIADQVKAFGGCPVVVPTVVDTERFRPRPEADRRMPVVGWIGSHSTFDYLRSVIPALSEVARRHPFQLLVVGSGEEDLTIEGVDVVCRPWSLPREVEDFQSLDVGLYPLIETEWSRGKSGFKAIQYMAVGIPFVATPIGVLSDIGEAGVTHYCAASHDEWVEALSSLLADGQLRRRMGQAGRAHALERYAVPRIADALAAALEEAAQRYRR